MYHEYIEVSIFLHRKSRLGKYYRQNQEVFQVLCQVLIYGIKHSNLSSFGRGQIKRPVVVSVKGLLLEDNFLVQVVVLFEWTLMQGQVSIS